LVAALFTILLSWFRQEAALEAAGMGRRKYFFLKSWLLHLDFKIKIG